MLRSGRHKLRKEPAVFGVSSSTRTYQDNNFFSLNLSPIIIHFVSMRAKKDTT